MVYTNSKVYLSVNQLKKIKQAVKKGTSVNLRIDPKMKSNTSLLLTEDQNAKLLQGKPFNVKMSITQVKALSKHGGFLITIPTLLAAAGAIGSLAGGAAGIAKAVNDKKVADKQLKEVIRHNKAMEGKGLFKKKKNWKGFVSEAENWKGFVSEAIKELKIPIKPLSQYDLMDIIKRLRIPNFKGVFMRDNLPKKTSVGKVECGILNLDSIHGQGTHWTCWLKKGAICYYFDSFGIDSPKEFDRYMCDCDILYSTYKIQKIGDVICGHLCIDVLYALIKKKIPFEEVVGHIFFPH